MKTLGKYILNESGKPIPEPDLMKWAMWFEGSDDIRRVARTVLEVVDPDKPDKKMEVTVSTVFLGMDYNFFGNTPILWETMAWGGNVSDQDRCGGSKEQAEAMHAQMVQKVKMAL